MITIVCWTSRFNLSVVKPDFINPCCFGEDFSVWLCDALERNGAAADLICMEDFGWANTAEVGGASYLVCVAGCPEERDGEEDHGKWYVMIEKRRSIWQKLLGRNKEARTDAICLRILDLLRTEGFENVGFDEDA